MRRIRAGLLFKHPFARSVLTLASGTMAAQIIALGASPILTRLYGPKDFGTLSLFLAIMGFLGGVSALRFEMAIPLPRDKLDAIALTLLSLLVVAVSSIVLALFTLFFGGSVAELINAQSVVPYMWLLPTGVFMVGCFATFNMWCVRYNHFGEIAKAKVVQSVVMVIVQLVGAGFGALGLLGGRVVGQLSSVLWLGLRTKAGEAGRIEKTIYADIRKVAFEYRRFPLVASWSALFSNFGAMVTPFLFAGYFGLEVTGVYGLTTLAMAAPMAFLGKAVEDVFYREAVLAHRADRLSQLILGIHSRLVLAAMPVALIVMLLLPDLFSLVFGAEWDQAGVFALYMLPWMFLKFTTTPCTSVFPILDRHGTALAIQASLSVAPVLAFLVGSSISDDPVAVVQVLSLLCSLIYLARLSLAHYYAKSPPFLGLRVLISYMPIAFVCVIPLTAIRHLAPEYEISSFAVLLSVVASLGIFAISAKLLWRRLPKLAFDYNQE